MATVRLHLDEHAIAQIPHSPEARALAAELGEKVKTGAKVLAPHRTGAGAASIYSTLTDAGSGWESDVSWTVHYMYFQQFGTHKMRAHPFLDLALARYARL